MRIIFAGTSDFVLPTLERLVHSSHQLVAVYTAPDRRAGRGLKLRRGAVKEYALAHKLPVEQVMHFDEVACQMLAAYKADLIVVMAYGLLFSKAALGAANLGCVNLHLSLLPRWRGAAPIVRTIEAGDEYSGVCLIKMTEVLDAGPIIAAQSCRVMADDTASSLAHRLGGIAPDLLEDFINAPQAMLAAATAQTAQKACYAPKLSKDEAWIDWTQPAVVIERKIRALNPWPVAQTYFNDRILRIWSATPCAGAGDPGRVIGDGRSVVIVACGDGALELQTLQMQNGKKISAADFANGYVLAGQCLRSFVCDGVDVK